MSASALLALVCLAPAAEVDPEPPSTFEALNRARIKQLIEKDRNLHRASIKGTAGNDNELTKGTVVIYKTNDGNFGKMMVVEHGNNLTIKWVTYDDKGVLSRGDKHIIRSTWQFDFDHGADGGQGKSRHDVWWRVQRNTHELIAENQTILLIHHRPKK
jgi:hypothetical protein